MREAAPYPVVTAQLAGRRMKQMLTKENNFQQPGERFRSWEPARQERFVTRMAGMLAHPRVTKDIRRIWLGYWAQVRLAPLVRERSCA